MIATVARCRAVDDAQKLSDRDLLLNVARERSLILCSALEEQRVRRMITMIDSAWTVGDRVPCTRGSGRVHWALIREQLRVR